VATPTINHYRIHCVGPWTQLRYRGQRSVLRRPLGSRHPYSRLHPERSTRASCGWSWVSRCRSRKTCEVTPFVVYSKDSKSIAADARALLGTRDESYILDVPSDGSPATLSANSTLGLYRGLTTFSQIWYTHNSNIYTVEAPISISDSPAFVRHLLQPLSFEH
jgi:hypothetical protein